MAMNEVRRYRLRRWYTVASPPSSYSLMVEENIFKTASAGTFKLRVDIFNTSFKVYYYVASVMLGADFNSATARTRRGQDRPLIPQIIPGAEQV